MGQYRHTSFPLTTNFSGATTYFWISEILTSAGFEDKNVANTFVPSFTKGTELKGLFLIVFSISRFVRISTGTWNLYFSSIATSAWKILKLPQDIVYRGGNSERSAAFMTTTPISPIFQLLGTLFFAGTFFKYSLLVSYSNGSSKKNKCKI